MFRPAAMVCRRACAARCAGDQGPAIAAARWRQSRVDAAAAVQFLYPDNVTIPAHHAAQIDLHFRVADGLHINSHAPLEKSLIPARLAVVEVQGLNVTAVDFPPGTEYALQLLPGEAQRVHG